MTDLLTRDAAILITAKAAKDAGRTPASFLRRYGNTEEEQESLLQFLSLMDIVSSTWRAYNVYDEEWELDNRGEYILVWNEYE